MNWLVLAEAAVVLMAIFLGVRTGGIGLGLWGAAGTFVLIFVFRMDPGKAPVDAFFIIIAVITASATMQAAGGIDFLVSVASRLIRRNPKHITFVAPLVSFVFTMGAGTGNIYFALIPVIYETSYRNGIRPERPLAASTVTSALGITASPVSAAMAAYLTLLPGGFGLGKILSITVPASIVACLATSFVQQRIGKELQDDPEFQRRVASGEIALPVALPVALVGAGSSGRDGLPAAAVPPVVATTVVMEVPPGGARSAYIFLAGVVMIVAMGLFSQLRPVVGTGKDAAPLAMTVVIELVMFTVALLILVVGNVKPAAVLTQPLLNAGLVAAIALFGIAWMADTFIAGNQKAIVEPLGNIVAHYPLFLAVALFLVAGLTTSQSATTRTLVPLALAAAMSPALVTAMWPSLIGVWLFPANGSQIAAVAIDKTGSTKLSKIPICHSFTIPMLVSWGTVVAAGLLISLLY